MKHLILIGALVLFSFFMIKHHEDRILWNEARPLTWRDFEGKPEARDAMASTAYDLFKEVKEENFELIISIKAFFIPPRSWKREKKPHEKLLVHEQKHFDIVELFARRLRKTIMNFEYRNYDQAVRITDSLYAIANKQMDQFQDRYDRETDGSRNVGIQKEWDEKIDAELNAYHDYKSADLHFRLPHSY